MCTAARYSLKFNFNRFYYKRFLIPYVNWVLIYSLTMIVIFLRCEVTSELQGKPDDIQALEKKLRSLFMDLGGGVPPTQGDVIAAEPASVSTVTGTSSPLGTCSTSSTPVTTPGSSQSANPLQPPSSLALGSPAPVQGPGTPIATTAQIGS